ncbi:MAG TPA: hypothetical protein VGC15_17495 [Acetobacteraceae bacterium]
MKPLACLALLLSLAACSTFNQLHAPPPIPAVCEDQVYADPQVHDLIIRSLSGTAYARNHEGELQAAKNDAALRCMQAKGLAPRGGGVERPKVVD